MNPRPVGEAGHTYLWHLGVEPSPSCSSRGATVFPLFLLWSFGVTVGADGSLCRCREEQVDEEGRPQEDLGPHPSISLPWKL